MVNTSENIKILIEKLKEIPILFIYLGHYFIVYNEQVYDNYLLMNNSYSKDDIINNTYNKNYNFFILNNEQVDKILSQEKY